MPSDAYNQFHRNLLDVDRLIEAHVTLNPEGGGRRGFGHLTRSGVVMLCACWERYIEQVLLEAIGWICLDAAHPTDLPGAAQRQLSLHVRKHAHELRPLELANDGWLGLYHELAVEETEKLNTPKSAQIDSMYDRFLGIQGLSNNWSLGIQEVDDFVSLRGDIAHNGREARYVQRAELEQHRNKIWQTVIDTDNFLARKLREINDAPAQPWRRTTAVAFQVDV